MMLSRPAGAATLPFHGCGMNTRSGYSRRRADKPRACPPKSALLRSTSLRTQGALSTATDFGPGVPELTSCESTIFCVKCQEINLRTDSVRTCINRTSG